jgi:hypothetical protein
MQEGEKCNRMLDDLDLNSIQDEKARQCIIRLMNIVEELSAALRASQNEVQRLRDELNRVKGEQGKPDIKSNKQSNEPNNHSSEKERHKPKEHNKSSKIEKIKIDRQEALRVDRTKLPADAEFKGYEEVIVQDIQVKTDNVLFLKEKYYSATEGKTYLASQPAGYEGEYGPGIKAMAITLYYGANMSEPKIVEFLTNAGISISVGQLSNLLIKKKEEFHKEKEDLYKAGLSSSPWHNVDDTTTRVNGKNQYCHIVCNPLYTAYFTTEQKNRLTIIDVLRGMRERAFRLNGEAESFLQQFGLPEKVMKQLKSLPQDQDLSEQEFTQLLDEHLPALGPQQRKHILEAAAAAAYHAELEFPLVRLIVCDDAPQFKLVTEELALCWIHDGRHYKKLEPFVARHQKLLDGFLTGYWNFYDELLNYRTNPGPEDAKRLEKKFDTLFSTVTGYNALDQRIDKTRAKKESLLMALHHPEIPLHNNSAELGARLRVRKRDVSFGPRTADGKRAWDTFNTLFSTAKKLSVNFFHYIYDRVSGANQMPSLAELIDQKAQQLNLDASWHPT